MSSTWQSRKSRLSDLLNSPQNEEEEALALDRILHGQSVIGKTSKTVEVEKFRFSDKDLASLGTLDRGQFGEIDIVSCNLDGRVYARKSLEKRFALRNRDQFFPQLERDLLLRARKTQSTWAPHLLCAFQTPTHLNLVMDFAEGGTLWDVLESSPLDGRILESDIEWWAPQIVSAINWCHQEGFAHRDIKPHNFVLTQNSHVLLIDFGSAAPLLPTQSDGSRLIPRKHCFVPCGTCDYISPEILEAHEAALVALEMSTNGSSFDNERTGGYGVEVDWWSLGAMLYEMVYGVAPFYANDIKQTYFKITNHQRHLRFDRNTTVSHEFQDLLKRWTHLVLPQRLGREGFHEIMHHDFFSKINWSKIRERQKPSNLHLPQFNYDMPLSALRDKQELSLHSSPDAEDSDASRPFAFSAFLQSSQVTSFGASSLQMTPAQKFNRSNTLSPSLTSFIGFSWGPTLGAFGNKGDPPPRKVSFHSPSDNMPFKSPYQATPKLGANLQVPHHLFTTPMRPSNLTQLQSITRTSTIRRTAPRRNVSDREAMKQLVDLVGMSARKKVMESGRKPRVLTISSLSGTKSRSRSSTLKELRFDPSPLVFDRTTSSGENTSRFDTTSLKPPNFAIAPPSEDEDPSETDTETETEVPPSPSPSPRPGSAMSIMSKRSQTPTMTGSILAAGRLRAELPNDAAKSLGLKGRQTPEIPDTTLPRPQPRDMPVPETDDSLSSTILDDFEKRHARLIADITGIHRRIDRLASQVS